MTRGSRQYWPHRRAQKRMPRVRSYMQRSQIPKITNFVGFKVGMTNITVIDDSEAPSKQQEVERACTIVEIPEIELYGMRLYSKNKFTGYIQSTTEIYDKKIAEKLHIKKIKFDESKLEEIKGKLDNYVDVSALLVAYPKSINVEQKHPMRFESHINAKTLLEKFEYVQNQMGKQINISDVFKNGEYIDVASITQGKGWQGVIKRYGVARLPHKATQKIRHMAPLGSFGMGRVLYTVPRAGQMGFNYRTEKNKRIIKMGDKSTIAQINKPGGYIHYGNVSNNYVIIDGSLPGPAKRLVRLREGMNRYNNKGIKEPKIIGITL